MKKYIEPYFHCYHKRHPNLITTSYPIITPDLADPNTPCLTKERDEDWNNWENGK